MSLKIDDIYLGDSRHLMNEIDDCSISLSVWSPPYHVGKSYEAGQSYEEWLDMLGKVIKNHFRILKPGGFLVINIEDILCFADENMPRIQAENVSMRRVSITKEDILKAMAEHPDFNRQKLAVLLGTSEQTIDRRLHGNNIRGGKYSTQTRVKIIGGLIEEMALDAGLYPYDRRIWVKDHAWANSEWSTNSYRSVDEFEYLYFFWKPGITKVDRKRLTKEEWSSWGSRGVWNIQSVRKNDDHEAKFPIELPRRVIQLLTDPGDVVIDPFMGSGTTALACICLGRHYVGIDKEEKYVKLAKNNIANFVPPLV